MSCGAYCAAGGFSVLIVVFALTQPSSRKMSIAWLSHNSTKCLEVYVITLVQYVINNATKTSLPRQ
jgi:hypothetical protein